MKPLWSALIVSFALIASIQASVLRVNTSAPTGGDGSTWPLAYSTLHDALAVSTNGDQIWVAAGVYYPDRGVGAETNNPAATFIMKDGVALLGGFAGNETSVAQRDPAVHVTVLSGDVDDNDLNSDGSFVAETPDDVVGENALTVIKAPVYGSNVLTRLDGFTITAGKANPYGAGGLSVLLADGLTVENCRFIGNAANDGGAVSDDFGGAVPGSSVSFIGCQFVHNTASSDGGAGYFEHNSTVRFENCLFASNSAAYYGGAVYAKSGNVQIVGCTARDNNAQEQGGAAFVTSATANISSSVFTNNSAVSGAGIYLLEGTQHVANCGFANNTATGEANQGGGGGITVSGDGDVSDCSFTGNTAASGGGLSMLQTGSQILRCYFESNSASTYGGGASIQGISTVAATVTNCTFVKNSADFGGGLYLYLAAGHFLSGCQFFANHASSGGGIYLAQNSYGTLADCRFAGNTATSDGGATFATAQTTNDVVFNRCLLSGNYAGRYGGGAFLQLTPGRFISSAFVGNAAGSKFGGLNCDGGLTPTNFFLVMDNCTFAGNAAPLFGAVTFNGATATIRHSIFYANASDGDRTNQDATISVGLGVATFSDCLVEGSGGSGAWNFTLDAADGGGNYDLAPQFLITPNPLIAPNTNGDVRLAYTSPAIDRHGAPSGVGSLDLAGGSRIADGNFDGINSLDTGAFEYNPDFQDLDDDRLWDRFEHDNTQPPSLTELSPDANSDGDDLNNLEEFALGFDPFANDANPPFLKISIENLVGQKFAVLTYPQNPGSRSFFQISVEQSADLAAAIPWNTNGLSFHFSEPVSAAQELVHLRSTEPIESAPIDFFRMRIVPVQ